jgi:hypothetical protein
VTRFLSVFASSTDRGLFILKLTGYFIVVLGLLVAACTPPLPSPVVTVNVTVVDDNQLGTVVGAAIASTQQSSIAQTETALARAGITLTPTPTATATITPLPPTETPYLSPTSSPTATSTPTPTITPLPTNTPNPLRAANVENGQVRVVHAWRSLDSTAVDVFMDELPIALGLGVGAATTYQRVSTEGVIRVQIVPPAVRRFNPLTGSEDRINVPPIVDELVAAPPGSSITVVLTNLGEGPTTLIVNEDIAPLRAGKARLTLVQAHPGLVRLNVVESSSELVLVRNMDLGDIVGPFDFDQGRLVLDFADAQTPEQLLLPPTSVQLDPHINYLVILMPGLDFQTADFSTQILTVQGSTRLTATDVPVRFVNAAPNVGPISIMFQDAARVTSLPVGEMTVPIPFSRQGGRIIVFGADGNSVFSQELAPWNITTGTERILLIGDLPPEAINQEVREPTLVEVLAFDRQSASSSALANIRLIHGLTGATQTLDLEIRATNPDQIDNPIGVPLAAESDFSWSRIVRNVAFGEVSTYVNRAANVFDLRIVLSSSGGVQATVNRQAMLPGGAYDILAVPGPGVGVTRLLVLQPDPQVSILGSQRGDPKLIEEIVAATLTAAAPNVTETAAVPRSPTPTISPVPTNTPRPTSTPQVKPAGIEVIPAPPNTTRDVLIIAGENFEPNANFVVTIDNGPALMNGRVSPDGRFSLSFTLPINLAPGAHTLQICVDCRVGGAQQAAFAVFLLADPLISPTPTLEP